MTAENCPALMNTYGARNLKICRGEGVYVFDEHGNRYLDALSGIAVNGLGHSHPAVLATIELQAKKLIHASNLYYTDSQQKLAEKLCSIAGMESAFFCNSGSEANETAIKISRKYAMKRGISSPKILTAFNSFHGRSLANISASGKAKYRDNFFPRVEGFDHIVFNDINSLYDQFTDDVVAVMLEPIQGEGGVILPDNDYLKAVREFCDKTGCLLILDEVQSGNGRTGSFFAFQQHNLTPDILTTAKGLANGLPVGACLVRGAAKDILSPGDHGSTFGGNSLVAEVALTVIDEIMKPSTVTNVKRQGRLIVDSLKETFLNNLKVKDVRGIGLMIAIELFDESPDLVERAQANGILINVIDKKIVRLLPPLILTDAQAAEICNALSRIINDGAL